MTWQAVKSVLPKVKVEYGQKLFHPIRDYIINIFNLLRVYYGIKNERFQSRCLLTQVQNIFHIYGSNGVE